MLEAILYLIAQCYIDNPIGELMAVDIRSFDEGSSCLWVGGSLGTHGYVDPKNNSFRWVEILPEGVAAIKDQISRNKNFRKHQIEVQRKSIGMKREDFQSLFLHNPSGSTHLFTRKRLVRVCRRVERLAGLEEADLKTVRHTSASRMLTAGINLSYLKGQLGHSTVQMTESVYAKWIEDLSDDHLRGVYKSMGVKYEKHSKPKQRPDIH